MHPFWTDKRGIKSDKPEPKPKPAKDVWVSSEGTYIYRKGEK